MNVISWLISKIFQFFTEGNDERRSSSMAREKATRANVGRAATKARNFDADYRDALTILKTRMGNSFPDNYHARLRGGTNSVRDFGDERAETIDTASAAIAEALRSGATVEQAAEAGAASVGI